MENNNEKDGVRTSDLHISQKFLLDKYEEEIKNAIRQNQNLIICIAKITSLEVSIDRLTNNAAINEDYFIQRKFYIDRRDALQDEISGVHEINVDPIRKKIELLIRNN